ncbi:MAG: LCP family protein [Oscillospiraceae bacterium]|nr:LCP family protein [Oscillospiraceae bacterium]
MFNKIVNNIARKIAKHKKEQNRRRRSNWYIYLISFAATSLILVLFITAFQDLFFPQANTASFDRTGRATYLPEAELDTTVLFMMSDEPGGVPRLFMLMNYRPREGVIALVPLSADTRVATRADTGRLSDIYRNGRSELVVSAINHTFGIDCKYYVKFDRAAFTTFTANLGEIAVIVPSAFQGGGLVLDVGEHDLSGAELFQYMNNADFQQVGAESSGQTGLNIIGGAMRAFINTNLRNMFENEISGAFNRVINNTTTNVTYPDFVAYQRAFHHTSNNTITPASVYVPEGTHTEDEFIISDEALNHIKFLFAVYA